MVSLADIVRGEGARYLQTRFATFAQQKAMYDIVRCRTEAMGTVSIACDRCSLEYRLFRSCRNRSCPRCQGESRSKWLEARLREILPGQYSHVVFSTPAELDVLALYCPEIFYGLVIRAAGQAIIDVGRSEFQAQLGCQVHLQTWGQCMTLHPHAHCVVPCGGFSEDGSRWISFEPDDLPAEALLHRFRTLLRRGIETAARQGRFARLPDTVSVEKLLATVMAREWSIYSKAPFGGVETLLAYLARYTYRVAITNDRIQSYENHQVTFRWRDYRHGNEEKRCIVDGQEFLRRFLMHVPPRGFIRIRSFGFMGNRNRKANLERARQLTGTTDTREPGESFKSLRLCPACSGRDAQTLHLAPAPEVQTHLNLPLRAPPVSRVAA